MDRVPSLIGVAPSEWCSSAWGAKLGADLHLFLSEGSVSDPAIKSTPQNSSVNSDPEATLDSAAAPWAYLRPI